MYDYLNIQKNKKQKSRFVKLDYFYWKYIYGDIVISKFINFLTKSGYKNRAIRLFFKALFNLKLKFGINPILLIKYVILKRNILHKVTKKKVKKKTFFYLRLLDFDKQISNTIKKIMELIFFLKEKKNLKLWQSIFVVLLNFCILKNKKKMYHKIGPFDTIRYSRNIFLLLKKFKALRSFFILRNNYFSIYYMLKRIIYLLSKNICNYVFIRFFFIYNDVSSYSTLISSLNYLLYNKMVLFYLWVIKYRLFRLKLKYILKLRIFKVKLRRFFISFKRLKKKYITKKSKQLKRYKYRKYLLLKNKKLLRNKLKQQFLTRFFFKELNDLKKASKFKNSFLNFKLLNKKKRELAMGTRIHAKHDVRLRHRKIFFRVSKYGQNKK